MSTAEGFSGGKSQDSGCKVVLKFFQNVYNQQRKKLQSNNDSSELLQTGGDNLTTNM